MSAFPKKVTTDEGKAALQVSPWQAIVTVATAITAIAAAFGTGSVTAPKVEKDYVDLPTVKALIKESDEFLTPQEANEMALDMIREQRQSEHVRDYEPKVDGLVNDMNYIKNALESIDAKIEPAGTP